ncbi:MAG: chemotaxis protein CheC, partial [Candidatus Omnitrophota bacterium]
KRKPGTTRKLNELDKSALKEVGNIICGSFLTVFSNTLKIKIVENVPSLSFDMFGAVVDVIIAEFAQKAEDALVIEVKFVFEHANIKGYVVLIFGLEEMKAIMKALGVEEEG